MVAFLLSRSTAFLLLLAYIAPAEGRERPNVRPLPLLEHSNESTQRIYVKGAIVTTLRFEKPVDPERTKMLGWEGRLEPLAVVRDKVILNPVHDLDDNEAIPLLVTLVDGTEVSFLLRPPGTSQWSWTDQQVDVLRDRDSYAALHSQLTHALQKNGELTEENERYHKEETSEDHALAALLASGALAQTPFKVVERFFGQEDETTVDAKVFRGRGKAAVVLTIKNLDTHRSWSMTSARLMTRDSGLDRPVAVRTTFRELVTGTSGVIALVVDGSAFLEDGKPTHLALDVYRDDGLRQARIELDPRLVAR